MTITPSQLAEWKRLADAATEGPRLYRSKEFDDWGFVRSARSGRLVLIGRAGDDDAELDAHRAAGTDPYGPNARFAVAARTAVPALVAEVERLRDFARAAVVAFDLAAELAPDNVINFAQFAIDASAVLPKEPADG